MNESAPGDSVASSRNGFSAPLRDGCAGYVRQGTGLPAAAYAYLDEQRRRAPWDYGER
jgi:hypothetical protein